MPYYNGVINRAKTPAAQSGTLSERPAPTYENQLFFNRSNPQNIQQVVGGAWIVVADTGAGTTGTLQTVTQNGAVTTIQSTFSGGIILPGTTAQYVRGDGSLQTFPTNVSAFTNDAGYVTASSSNTFTNKSGNISQWTNNAGYLTAAGAATSVTGSGHITASPTTGAVIIGSDATDANTASTIVARDASGNFSAGVIAAALNGNASTATNSNDSLLWNNQAFSVAGLISSNNMMIFDATATAWKSVGAQSVATFLTNRNMNIIGNASTATVLETARTIQGVSFNGSADINIINGTGFVKATGTTISYDNSTYVTASSVTTFTNKSGIISQWTNDSGYVTASSSNTFTNKAGNISQWTNDSGYVTASSVSTFTNKSGNISQWTDNVGYALDANVVHKTGAENVGGVKTFTDNPVVKLNGAQFEIFDNTAYAAGTGGILNFDATYDGTAGPAVFARIKGVRENGTINNFLGSMILQVSDAANVLQTAVTIASSKKVTAVSSITAASFIANSAADNGVDVIQSGGGSILGNLYRAEGKTQATSATIDATATHWSDNTNGSTVTYTLPNNANLQGGYFLFSKVGTGILTLSGTIITTAGVGVGSVNVTSASGMKFFYYNGSSWYQLN